MGNQKDSFYLNVTLRFANVTIAALLLRPYTPVAFRDTLMNLSDPKNLNKHLAHHD
jgi:hypothetical protein